LRPSVGGKNRASEILSRKRPLTLAMIRALHEKLGIPSELLIQQPRAEYRVERKPRKTKSIQFFFSGIGTRSSSSLERNSLRIGEVFALL